MARRATRNLDENAVILTVEVVLEVPSETHFPGAPWIALVARSDSPPVWALPGGIVADSDRSVASAAYRRVLQEVGCAVILSELFGVYSTQGLASVVFIGRGNLGFRAEDLAIGVAKAFPTDALPGNIPFGHRQILRDYAVYKMRGHRPDFTR
jgi:ADP-ribose pyrophosphatase YjhB (NUDIX family)